ncbi:MAG: STAS domain-containing protein, partial [Spirochaetota bacterium]
MKIQYTTSDTGKSAFVRCSSPIDRDSAAEFTALIENLTTRGVSSVILDLSGAGYIESEGITAVANAHKKFRGMQGILILAGINREIASVLKVLGLYSELLI